MKPKTEKIPDSYRSLRSQCLSPSFGATKWRFSWYIPGPDYGYAYSPGETLKRLIKKSCIEKFVNAQAANEYIMLKERELRRIWAGKGPVIEGFPDSQAEAKRIHPLVAS